MVTLFRSLLRSFFNMKIALQLVYLFTQL